MKANAVLVGLLGLCLTGLILLHYRSSRLFHDSSSSGKDGDHSTKTLQHFADIIRIQNESIALLETLLVAKDPKMSSLMENIHEKDDLIRQLTIQLEETKGKLGRDSTSPKCPASVNSGTKTATSLVTDVSSQEGSVAWHDTLADGLEKDCEMRYGISLINIWRKNSEVWCDSPSSQLKCYPYHQHHKKLDGRGPDLFCEATNFVIDFSKVHGDAGDRKPSLGDQYLRFDTGSLSSSCHKTDKYKQHMFMPHHALQMRSFTPGAAPPSDHVVHETTTYVLARDEDCENSFHSTADFMNMYLVMRALDVSPQEMQVMLFDKHPDGPYLELISKAYSPNHAVIRNKYFTGKKVLFKRLIFHLESPAGLIFPKVSRPDPLRCYNTGLFHAYRKFVLQAFSLYNVQPPAIPTVTLSLRHRTPHKNVGRILANEEELIKVLKEGNLMNLNVVDTAKMSFFEQLKLIRSTNVLVGVHGAGLMFIMFAAEEAVLVEMHPSYRQDRHFRHAARMTGKIYMPLRTLQRETCQGTSDNVFIPVDEFRKTMDGALRIARSFDDGLSECGLVCPPSILALDSRLDGHYKSGERKSAPVNTHFPCG